MPAEAAKRYPIQQWRGRSVPERVYLAAYEVYCHLYGPQPAMVENECRGGFSPGEMIGFLYARAFPRHEWDARFHEAIAGSEESAPNI